MTHHDHYREQVLAAYQGEIAGEALFSRLLEQEPDPGCRHVLACMLQLETETKMRLRQLLARLGLPVAERTHDRAAGVDWADGLRQRHGEEWPAAFAHEVAEYAQRYDALRDAAPAADRPVLDYLAAHERGLERSLHALAAADLAGATGPLVDLLHYPPPPPAD